MLRTTLGQLITNEALPEEYRDYSRTLDGKGVKALLERVAQNHPDQYKQIVKRLSDVGRDLAYATGGFSFGLNHLKPAKAYVAAKQQIEAEIDQITNNSEMDDDAKQKAIVTILGNHQKPLEAAIYREALENNNPLATQVLSGSRGKPMNLKSLLGADLLMQDHRDNLIPIPMLRGYSQGLSPAEYFAGSFGARKGVIDTKFATQNAGFFSKQLNQAAHRLIVTQRDAETPPDTPRGLPVESDDLGSLGSLLAHPVGGYSRNALITARVLKDLRERGINKLLVRSPIIGGPGDGGLYGWDVGVRERGGVAPIGDQVGITAAQALSEPINQGGLSSKHSGGVAGASKTVGGFKGLNQLTQVPKTYPGGAAHSEVDGRVQAIVDAPAGGKYVVINGERHYVSPGFDIHVKPGDEIEAGDVLSEGLPNPAKVVKHKGIGEGRRYFVKVFHQAMKDAGIEGERRNLELVSRGLINHVRLTDEMGDYVPDDIVSYDQLERTWEPRVGTRQSNLASAVGKYLEKPILHHSIGTKVTRKMLSDLEHFGVKTLDIHDDPPPFEPEMIRGMENLQHDPDWMSRMLGSNLQKSLLSGVHRGATSNEMGTSFVPALANPVEFGRKGLVHGFDPKTIVKLPEPKPAGVLEGL
jgi:DNA-directed RNA polymerase subunit beta'